MTTLQPAQDPAFWEGRYQAGRTGWERGVPTPSFLRLLESPTAPAPGRMAVPGCGRGHDALSFAARGYEVTGFDFAPSAVTGARELAAAEGLAHLATFVEADMFAIAEQYVGTFDFVLERACFCAIAPVDRGRYVASVRALLRPGGRLVGSFFVGPAEGGPPFAASWEEIHATLAEWFDVEELGEPEEDSALDGADQFAILRMVR